MSECVLVVDDDKEIVKAIAILLKGEGYEVLKAYDGMQALALLAANPVPVVLSCLRNRISADFYPVT